MNYQNFQNKRNGINFTMSLFRIRGNCEFQKLLKRYKTKYLDHIIIGLDRANETQAKKLGNFLKN